jgi:hypothetical protein
MSIDLRDLGPPIPDGDTMIRTPAFRLVSWSIQRDTNSAGDAVLLFNGAARGYDETVLLLVNATTTTGEITSCTLIRPDDMMHELLPLAWLPGLVMDLTRTKVREVFSAQRAT